MIVFPDPSVETEYTDPNGVDWIFDGTGWVKQCDCPDGGGDTGKDFGVVCLIDGEGPDGSEDIIDISGNLLFEGLPATVLAGPPIITHSDSKYGQGCVEVKANGSSAKSDRGIVTGPNSFTIEFWLKRRISTGGYLFEGWNLDTPLNVWGIRLLGGTDSQIGFAHAGGQTEWSNATIPLNVWTHVAFSYNKDDQELKIFIDGILDGAKDLPSGMDMQPTTLFLGSNGSANTNFRFDDFRYTERVARYSDDFTPPDEFPKTRADGLRRIATKRKGNRNADLS